MKNIILRQINIFIRAAKHLSFTRAAEELHITAPAVSLQMKQMEVAIGLNLFNRVNKKIALASAAECFYFMPCR